MKLTADATLAFPRAVVFRAYRDELVELVDVMPNIRRIEIESRVDDGPISKVVNVWHGGGEIPGAARAVLSESMLSWHDHALWDESDWTCTWRIVTHSFTDAVKCEGKNRFVDLGTSTRLEIRGDLGIDVSHIKAVPRLLRGSVQKAVEEFLVKRIAPNLLEVSHGLGKHLEKRHPA